MKLLQVIALAFQFSMGATIFAYGLRARNHDLLYVLRRPGLLMASLSAVFVVTPAIALLLNRTFDFPLTAKVAIMAMAISPVSLLLPRKHRKSGGHSAYAVGLNLAIILVSLVLTPSLVEVLGWLSGNSFESRPLSIAKVLLGVCILPLALGRGIQKLWPAAASSSNALIDRIANIVLSVAIVLVLAGSFRLVSSFMSFRTLLAMTAFSVAAFGIGHLMGGPATDHAQVLAFACACRHPAIAFSITAPNYKAESCAAAIILFLMVNAIVRMVYVKWQRRRTPVLPETSGQQPRSTGPAAA